MASFIFIVDASGVVVSVSSEMVEGCSSQSPLEPSQSTDVTGTGDCVVPGN